MSYLLHTLRAQHSSLTSMAAAIEDALSREAYLDVVELLPQFKEALLAHLELEEQVYPTLLQAAEHQHQGRVIESTRLFRANMVFIQRSMKEFLSRWSVELIATAAFREEWFELMDLLQARIHAEEQTLYSAYEALVEGVSEAGKDLKTPL